MLRALQLAATMLGLTGENPSVGCVLVKDGNIVGEGATQASGRPHAEEIALAQAGDQAPGATAYVTLEPCARRTSGAPGCATRLRDAGIARVVIAAADPHPFAAGQGVALLQAAGVAVEQGLLEPEARAQNAAFIARFSG
ncbi:MAG: bifunctional diaminohydroxyphosphoribosylaminopyrimidine deaminase/5-amino-6-(5-phosphoribosylamino)uracil reductase RibD [Hyphomonadaceae bacterium]|nr:bifunctional diaminohydroxyphosphoribosylaminopyrimidine deaminase/5-amino-6-(5-phosphoribosylamino)uracil reductase RibD [Hyphomonadaceae bacterium]